MKSTSSSRTVTPLSGHPCRSVRELLRHRVGVQVPRLVRAPPGRLIELQSRRCRAEEPEQSPRGRARPAGAAPRRGRPISSASPHCGVRRRQLASASSSGSSSYTRRAAPGHCVLATGCSSPPLAELRARCAGSCPGWPSPGASTRTTMMRQHEQRLVDESGPLPGAAMDRGRIRALLGLPTVLR